MNVMPTQGYILIEPIKKETKTKAGIYLPRKGKSNKARVVAIGKRFNKKGNEIKPEFMVGDIVVYRKWEVIEAKIGDKKLVFAKFKDILAKEVK
jgi:co-chaperonin GroES (HSP10)